MALVDYRQKIIWEIVEQTERAHSGLSPVEIAAVVLDTWAMAYLAHHLYVVGDALVEPLGFEFAGLAVEESHLFAKIKLNLCYSAGHTLG